MTQRPSGTVRSKGTTSPAKRTGRGQASSSVGTMSTLPVSATGLSEPSSRTIRSRRLGRSNTGLSGARASTVDTRAASPNHGLSTPGGTPPSSTTAVRSSRKASRAAATKARSSSCIRGAASAGVLTAADATRATAAATATTSSRRLGAASRSRATGRPEKLGAGVCRRAAATTRVSTSAASAPWRWIRSSEAARVPCRCTARSPMLSSEVTTSVPHASRASRPPWVRVRATTVSRTTRPTPTAQDGGVRLACCTDPEPHGPPGRSAPK